MDIKLIKPKAFTTLKPAEPKNSYAWPYKEFYEKDSGANPAQGLIPRPIGTPGGWSEDSLNQSAANFILSKTGEDDDSLFGSVDGGNCGLSAYIIPENKASALLQAGKEIYHGSQAFKFSNYDPAKQRMIGVLTSEDEPKMFICLQSKANGSSMILDEINFAGIDFANTLSPAVQEALVPQSSGLDRSDDWNFLVGSLQNSQALNLGGEEDHSFWWK